MRIQISQDIDRYKESVVLGLTARQLIFSLAALAAGAGTVFLLYPAIGITGAAYVAIPVIAPIGIGGFYNFNGMNFYEATKLRIFYAFKSRPLLYASTEKPRKIKESGGKKYERIFKAVFGFKK